MGSNYKKPIIKISLFSIFITTLSIFPSIPVFASDYIPLFNGSNAYNLVATQLGFGFRVPGYTAHSDCASWIQSQLADRTDFISSQSFTKDSIQCQNILGKMNTGRTNIVIFAAHWDSRAVAEKDPDPLKQNLPIPGANDGASGVAVLLELARVLFPIKGTLTAEIWFLFLDAEDQGKSNNVYGIPNWDWCEGAKSFTSNIHNYYDEDTECIESFILLDMVGGTNLRFIQEYYYTDQGLYNDIWGIGQMLGYTTAFPNNPTKLGITDDHKYFDAIGIPSVDLIIDFRSGNLNWDHHHKQSDNLTNIDQTSLEITGKTLETYIDAFYTGKTPPDFNNPGFDWSSLYWVILVGAGVGAGTIVIVIINKIQYKRFLKMKENSLSNNESSN